MGQYGQARREKFMIYTSGEGKVLPFLSLGYAGYMLHYANSEQAKGLVDNILLNPTQNLTYRSSQVSRPFLSVSDGFRQCSVTGNT